jgi:osmotically-inducible protein OsmY
LAALTTSVANAAEVKDTWITTKAKIVLLTSDGFRVSGVNVDTVNGNVTLHGKVTTKEDKALAEQKVQELDGVKSVKNLLQVVPTADTKTVAARDADIKDHVEAALKHNQRFEDVTVASVNKGVVLLSGKTRGLDDKLAAVESAYTVGGVRRVATEIETAEN